MYTMEFLLIGNHLAKLHVPYLNSRFLLEAGCEPYWDGPKSPFLGEPRLQHFQFHLKSDSINYRFFSSIPINKHSSA